jgi:PAS domain S-box-containing protein
MNTLLRILLVEDNQGDVDLIRELVTETGMVSFSIESVPRLSEALSRLKDNNVDLVLLDLGLPDSSGLETFARLKAAAPAMPTIILTGNSDQEAALTAVRGGAQDYLIKGQISGSLIVRSIRYALERKRAEQKLLTAEKRYRQLIEGMMDAFVRVDMSGRILEFNRAYMNLTGYSEEEIKGMSYVDITPEPWHAMEADIVKKQVLSRGYSNVYEKEYRRKDGSIVPIELRINLIVDEAGGASGMWGIVRDITERKQAEAALRDTENRYRLLFDQSPDGIVIIDTETLRFQEFNEAACRQLGYSREELTRLTISDIDVVETPEDTKKQIAKVILEGRGDFETLHRTRQGEIRNIYVTAQIIEILGCPVYHAVWRDITERKQAEALLNESNDKVMQILNATAEGIFGVDLLGHCTFCNPACITLLGYRDEHDIIGKNMHNLILHTRADGTPYPEEDCIVYKSLRSGKNFHIERELFWRADGLSFPAEYWAYPILKDHRVQGTVVSFVDRSDQAALHDQLRQAQKMEAVGTLTGGIAHDFNNILSAIIGYGYVTIKKMPQDDPLRSNIEHILESADHAALLIKSLLAFSRKQVLNRKPVDLKTVLKHLESFLVRVIGEDVSVRMVLDDSETTILADQVQLEHAFMNLATNARDAMPAGGVFSIETTVTDLGHDFVKAHGFGKPGRYAVIAVSDTGIGMPEDTRVKIFDPFFTTKDVGKGTGLGLSMTYGIIKQHEGFINVYSEPGRGTTFRIYLPVSREAAVEAFRPVVSEDLTGGAETILLAEDDEHVREITSGMLEQMGYTVLVAEDGEEAVKKYLEHKDAIRLLLFDLIMPKKTGKDAYDEIRKITPDMNVIFLTGYAPDMIRQKGLLDDPVVMLHKPISPADLLNKVRSVLDKKTSSFQEG